MIRVSVDEDCPTEDFTPGAPDGHCWGDGHHKCDDCILFRSDFKSDPTLRDKLLTGQGFLQISTINTCQN